MKVNVEALKELASEMKWSIPELSLKLDVEYSYLSRVLNNKKNGGGKLFSGIYKLCTAEGKSIEDYIFLDAPLSTNNV